MEQGIKEPTGRIAEAVLIAVLSSLFERVYDYLRDRRAQRSAQETRITALEEQIATLTGKAD